LGQNPRQNDEASDRLADLIKSHGYRVPIIISFPDKVIRAGHTRLKALLKLGVRKVTVLCQQFKSKAEAEAFSIADNRSNEYATWDFDKLKVVLDNLASTKIDINITGFTNEEITSLIPDVSLSELTSPPFQKEEGFDPDGIPQEPEQLWCWFEVPTEKEYEQIKAKYSLNKGRDLNWAKLKPILLKEK